MHGLLVYANSGIGVALMIATIDLLTPKKPPMGVLLTLMCGVLWPATLAIMIRSVVRRVLKRD